MPSSRYKWLRVSLSCRGSCGHEDLSIDTQNVAGEDMVEENEGMETVLEM